MYALDGNNNWDTPSNHTATLCLLQVNVVAFSRNAQTPDAPPSASNSTCYSHQLVTLTLQNKDHLTDFINDLQTDADTFYIPAFTTAFQLLRQAPDKEGTRGDSAISV